MAQTYSFEEMLLLNYDKLPNGVDLSCFNYEETLLINEVSELKDELNHLKLGASQKSIDSIMAFSAAHCALETKEGIAEMMLN